MLRSVIRVSLGCLTELLYIRICVMRKPYEWTEEKLRYLEQRFPIDATNDIARVLGCSGLTVLNKARSLGLRKSIEFRLNNSYRKYMKKGQIKR